MKAKQKYPIFIKDTNNSCQFITLYISFSFFSIRKNNLCITMALISSLSHWSFTIFTIFFFLSIQKKSFENRFSEFMKQKTDTPFHNFFRNSDFDHNGQDKNEALGSIFLFHFIASTFHFSLDRVIGKNLYHLKSHDGSFTLFFLFCWDI